MNLPQVSEKEVAKLSQLLDEWKLKFLLPQFLAEKIDLDVLEIIDFKHANLLVQNFPIGVQMRFIHNLMRWRNQMGLPLNETTCKESQKLRGTTTTTVRESSTKQLFNKNYGDSHRKIKTSAKRNLLQKFKIDLKKILENSLPNGPDLIESYTRQQQHFTPHDRKRLLMTIINYFLECKMPINLQISYELENAIVQMFPSESLQKYRNSRYGKLYILYLREKNGQMDSERESCSEDDEEKQVNSNELHDDDDDDDDGNNNDDNENSDNLSDSLLCDLYDQCSNGNESFNDRHLEDEGENDHCILIQTNFEKTRKFVKILSPYGFKEFLFSARSTFRITTTTPTICNDEDFCVFHKEMEINELNFKSIILQNYKSLTFVLELKLHRQIKDVSSRDGNFLPDANFMRHIPNLLPFVKLSDAGKPLENSHRTMIAKTIIDECLQSNSEKILKRQDFLTLANNICKAFHTEVPSTYYVPCRDAQPARGKLLNAYNNKRYTLSALGRLERRPRAHKATKRKRYTYEEEKKYTNEHKFIICESEEFSLNSKLDKEKLLERWLDTYEERRKELEDEGMKSNEYLKKYSVLLQIACGSDLVIMDVKSRYPKFTRSIDNWLTLYENVVEKARNIRTFKNVQKTIEAIDASKDERYRASLALNLLVYIFPYTWRFSKSQVQQRFIKEFKTMEELACDSDPADMQIRFVHQSQKIIYADFCICGYVFECADLLDALVKIFHYIHALRLTYPRMCLRIWQFVQLAIFKLETTDVLLPQIECTINDLLYQKEKKSDKKIIKF